MSPLTKYLKEHSVRQEDFAATIGVTQATVSRLKSGAQDPSPSLARRIQDATGGEVKFYDWPAYRLFAPTTGCET